MIALRRLSAVTTLLFAAACSNGDTKGRTPLAGDGATPLNAGAGAPGGLAPGGLAPGMTPLSAALLDSGNVAFKLKQYPSAQRYYELAAAEVPTQASPWFGIYMVAQATGNTTLADSAKRMMSPRSGGSDLLTPDVGTTHPGGAAGAVGGAGTGKAGTAGPIPPGAEIPKGHPGLPPQ